MVDVITRSLRCSRTMKLLSGGANAKPSDETGFPQSITCKCAEAAPPGKRALVVMAGERVILTRHDDRILAFSVRVHHPWIQFIGVFPLTFGTMWILSRFTDHHGWGLTSGLLWVVVIPYITARRRSFEAGPGHGRACHIPERGVVSLELSNGKWMGVHIPWLAEDENALLAWLRDVYGTKMYEI